MQYTSLGFSGCGVSRIGLGTWALRKKLRSRRQFEHLIHAALAGGVNFFDTADSYDHGEVERWLGVALRRVPRDEVVISSKGGLTRTPDRTGHSASRKQLRSALDGSLRRLKVDYVDIYSVHKFDAFAPVQETFSSLDDFVRQGKILYGGVCNYGRESLEMAMTYCTTHQKEAPIVNQIRFNLLDGSGADAINASRALGLGVVGYSPLAEGALSGKYLDGVDASSRGAWATHFRSTWLMENLVESTRRCYDIATRYGLPLATVALRFALAQPGITSVLTAATDEDQLAQNMAAVDAVLPLDLASELHELAMHPGEPL